MAWDRKTLSLYHLKLYIYHPRHFFWRIWPAGLNVLVYSIRILEYCMWITKAWKSVQARLLLFNLSCITPPPPPGHTWRPRHTVYHQSLFEIHQWERVSHRETNGPIGCHLRRCQTSGWPCVNFSWLNLKCPSGGSGVLCAVCTLRSNSVFTKTNILKNEKDKYDIKYASLPLSLLLFTFRLRTAVFVFGYLNK
jgi:hypothetical protein